MDLCYHHNDHDGICSAAIVKAKKYLSCAYGTQLNNTAILNECAGRDVIIVDFSFPLHTMEFMKSVAKSLTWIDHHDTALKNGLCDLGLPGLFRDGTAACELAWEYFNPGTTMPDSVRYIGDRDVWKFAYTESKAYGYGLTSLPTSDVPQSELWSRLLQSNDFTNQILDIGRPIEKYLLNDMMWQARLRVHKIGDMLISNCTSNLSETGAYLIETLKTPLVMLWDVSKDGVKFHMRGKGAQEIAIQFGGGGHPEASGFGMTTTEGLQFLSDLYQMAVRVTPA